MFSNMKVSSRVVTPQRSNPNQWLSWLLLTLLDILGNPIWKYWPYHHFPSVYPWRNFLGQRFVSRGLTVTRKNILTTSWETFRVFICSLTSWKCWWWKWIKQEPPAQEASLLLFRHVLLQPGFAWAVAGNASTLSFAWAKMGFCMHCLNSCLHANQAQSFARVFMLHFPKSYPYRIHFRIYSRHSSLLTYFLPPPSLQCNDKDTAASIFPYCPAVCIMQFDCYW